MVKLTAAGRLHMVMELLGGQDILDDYGEPTGEKSPSLITKEQALELLNAPTEVDDGN